MEDSSQNNSHPVKELGKDMSKTKTPNDIINCAVIDGERNGRKSSLPSIFSSPPVRIDDAEWDTMNGWIQWTRPTAGDWAILKVSSNPIPLSRGPVKTR